METNRAKMKMVYSITEREGGKSFWTRIGVGFVNQDGSINLKLDAIPLNGQSVQVREWEPYDPARQNNGPGVASGNGGPRPPRPYREPPPLPRDPDGSPASLDSQLFGGQA